MLNNDSFQSLDEKLERVFSVLFDEKSLISLTNQVAMNPTLLKGEELNLFTSLGSNGVKLKDKVVLAMLSWYLPKEIGCLLNLRLEEIWGNERLDLKETLLDSKFYALGTILVQDLWNDNDFYGNILESNYLKRLVFKYFHSLHLKRVRKRARLTVRRRGHRDGGRKEKCRSFDKTRKKERPLEPVSVLLEEESLLNFKIVQLRSKIEMRWELENIS